MTTFNLLPVSFHTDSSKPLSTADRLSIIRWKKTKEVTHPHAAVCISVPKLTIEVQPACLKASLTAAYEELQDNLIRSIIEANSNKLSPISADKLSEQAVAAYAESENESKRLSGDTITAWFQQYVSDNLTLALITKVIGSEADPASLTKEQETQIENNVASAGKLLASLASPRSQYPEPTINQLIKVLALSSEQTEIAETLKNKLTKMKEPKEVSLSLDL